MDTLLSSNIDRNQMPFDDEDVDLSLANQVLEHTKEISWIFHEVSNCLAVGGHFIFGVPNICSLHNRLLMLAGEQPAQHRLCSAPVRPFSKKDTLKSIGPCFPDGYSLVQFRGSHFYPFPRKVVHVFADAMPTPSYSILLFMIASEGRTATSFVGTRAGPSWKRTSEQEKQLTSHY
jgi:hypothetical protein